MKLYLFSPAFLRCDREIFGRVALHVHSWLCEVRLNRKESPAMPRLAWGQFSEHRRHTCRRRYCLPPLTRWNYPKQQWAFSCPCPWFSSAVIPWIWKPPFASWVQQRPDARHRQAVEPRFDPHFDSFLRTFAVPG